MILITGSNGQLGTAFQEFFDKLGIEYIATDKNELDITDKDKIKGFLKNKSFDYIINCAAYNDVDRAENEPEKCFALNSTAPENLAVAAGEMGAVYVTYSTDFVFDGSKTTPYIEEDKPCPLNIYSESKLQGEERVLKTYKKSFVIRTSWLFGKGENNFIKKIINWSKEKSEMKVVDDQVSVPTYSEDLAEYSWELIKSNKFGLYHITNNGEASKFQQAEYILKNIGWRGKLVKAKTEDFDLRAIRAKYSKLSSKKAEKVIGRKMPHWKNAVDRFLKGIKY